MLIFSYNFLLLSYQKRKQDNKQIFETRKSRGKKEITALECIMYNGYIIHNGMFIIYNGG